VNRRGFFGAILGGIAAALASPKPQIITLRLDRIDWNWYRVETKPISFYEVGGQTVWPEWVDANSPAVAEYYRLLANRRQ